MYFDVFYSIKMYIDVLRGIVFGPSNRSVDMIIAHVIGFYQAVAVRSAAAVARTKSEASCLEPSSIVTMC
jgi:hypothetical protein